MQMRITRPVVVATPAGLRHFAPGLEVTVTEAEATQIIRQGAGKKTGDAPTGQEAKPTKERAKAKQPTVTASPDGDSR